MIDAEDEEFGGDDEGVREERSGREPAAKELERIWQWLLEEAGSATERGDESGEELATRFLQQIQESWLDLSRDTEEDLPRRNP
eukprot:15847321-Heterocapsa_arctica.AAC.1